MGPNDTFRKKIIIDGLHYPVFFTFRVLHTNHRTEYKVRTYNPDSDFNMHNTNMGEAKLFKFSDETEIPEWIHSDKNAQEKLSTAIVDTL